MITQINTYYICDILYHSDEIMLRRASLLLKPFVTSGTYTCVPLVKKGLISLLYHLTLVAYLISSIIKSYLTRDLIVCKRNIRGNQRRSILYYSQVTFRTYLL